MRIVGTGYTGQFGVDIVGVIVSGIEVATDTLQVQLLLVVLIIEVRCHTIVGDTLREEVLMALLAGGVGDVGHGMLQLRLGVPLKIGTVFCQVGPNIF